MVIGVLYMLKKLFKEESGTIIVIVAISMTVILAFCALAIDLGRVSIQKSKLQTAVDAAVLAATQDLPDTYKARNSANKYIQLNGYEPSDISISFLESNSKIKIIATKKIKLTFAKVIGFDDTTITRSATGAKERMGGPFEYALFSGDRNSALSLNGSSFNITGGTHSNKNFTLNCSTATITGACEAVSGILINGSTINVNNRVPNATVLDMPDFSDTIKEKAENAGRVFYGNQTFNSTNVTIGEVMYVYGNVSFNMSNFKGMGTICATGNITFNGSNINATAEDTVCFYSKSGNISVNGSSVNFDGILYAPQGSIAINASTFNINGRVIGKTLGINASTIKIVSGTKELNSLPTTSIKLVE